jgi:hypothetical protein
MADVYAMAKAAKQAINDSELAGIFEESVAEQTMCWNEGDENAKIWLRSRPDLLVQARGLIVDFKTTGTQAEAFLWSRGPMLSNGFDIQAALGIRGIRHLFGSVAPKFVFAVIETYPPYAMSFVSLSPMYLAFAEHRLARAMLLWEDSLWTNTWAGYPTRICYCDPPTWSYAEEEGKI